MQKNKWIFSIVISLLLLIPLLSFINLQETPQLTERIKVALRAVGNDLLHSQNDVVSRVLPVKELQANLYQLAFENPFSFDPRDLNQAITFNFTKALLPENYLVEVISCDTKEVVYSYQKSSREENTLMPCGGRVVPLDCYKVQVQFIEKTSNRILFYVLVIAVLLFLVFVFTSRLFGANEHSHNHWDENNIEVTPIGNFSFYPSQNKLVQKATEIKLSNKECELLSLFVQTPNQVIKRETLSKKIWEDNGVIVGRSLDTYVSKLRKKLEIDPTIKITNVHGVGYMLEVKKL